MTAAQLLQEDRGQSGGAAHVGVSCLPLLSAVWHVDSNAGLAPTPWKLSWGLPEYEKTKEGPNLLIVHHTLPHKLHPHTSASQEEPLGLKPFSACTNPWVAPTHGTQRKRC